ncbi:MAG: SRPBCC family protein [Gammaproteobacteria bacterium]
MKRRTWLPMLLTALLVGGGPAALAHGPTPQKIEEHVIIARPPATVWAAIREFGAVDTWNPFFVEVHASGGNEPGKAERELKLAQGGSLRESLDEYDPARRYLGYRLLKENVEAFPVSFYTVTIEVKASGEGSDVEVLGRFYRADTGNFPPEHLNDEAAVAAMQKMTRTGLDTLQRMLEQGAP